MVNITNLVFASTLAIEGFAFPNLFPGVFHIKKSISVIEKQINLYPISDFLTKTFNFILSYECSRILIVSYMPTFQFDYSIIVAKIVYAIPMSALCNSATKLALNSSQQAFLFICSKMYISIFPFNIGGH